MSEVKFNTRVDEEILRETTRKERRNLLISSLVGLLVTKGGFVPTEITAFGIKFTESNKDFLLYGLGVSVIYFLSSFVLNSATDLLRLKVEKWNSIKEGILSGTQELDEETFSRLHEHAQGAQWFTRPIAVIYALRVLFEVLASIAVATYALFAIF